MEFARQWREGGRPLIEDYLARVAPEEQGRLLAELLAEELEWRRAAGLAETPQLDEYLARFPQAELYLRQLFSPTTPCVSNAGSVDAGNRPSTVPTAQGRYQLEMQIGEGGFGVVYRAHDNVLGRQVAIKVPRSDRFVSDADRTRFLIEAQTAVRLQHPGIVAIYDILREGDAIGVVQECVPGADLATWAAGHSGPLSPSTVVELLTEVAETLAYAHRQGFIHRDIKPANILLDAAGRPRVVDFGLALHESQRRRASGERSGTPAYMSPEQVRGESHRLDGRSDIWSLGVMSYELLTGRRPFHGETNDELFDDILHSDPMPLRQHRPELPPELERICLKCLEKRMGNRYTTAADLAEDLRQWLRSSTSSSSNRPPGTASPGGTTPLDETPTRTPRPSRFASDRPAVSSSVTAKGLRAFDEDDAGFFLELLPGPRGRDGLPESVRFWKTRLEATVTPAAFRVGVLYGSSGCGKSSLVRAGVLPLLGSHVRHLYLEATSAGTESRLRSELTQHWPTLAAAGTLADMLAELREGDALAAGQKLVVVIDQFEQWLVGRPASEREELATALRHCDGGRIQALLLVRDDFWGPAAEFLREVEVPIAEGENVTGLRRFDLRHARRVLTALGRAYGCLSAGPASLPSDQERFVERAVASLSEEGQVVSVRLALFADMLKGRPWTTAELRAVGGAAGVGVAFLDEMFHSRNAPLPYRKHEPAVVEVLSILLPEQVLDIRGPAVSREALRAASGYADRPGEFAELLHILDRELRLISPSEATPRRPQKPPARADARDGSPDAESSDESPASYQLTHDYLVPSIREWLRRYRQGTHAGRATCLLEERTAAWQARPERRQLPSWSEYLQILLWTSRQQRSDAARRMLRSATRWYASWLLAAAGLLAAVAWGLHEFDGRTHARILVDNLQRVTAEGIPPLLDELHAYGRWTRPLLEEQAQRSGSPSPDARARLHARLAVVASDPAMVDPLLNDLDGCDLAYLPVLVQCLAPYRDDVAQNLSLRWRSAETKERRWRAGLVLCQLAPQTIAWTEEDLDFLANQLLAARIHEQELVYRLLRPLHPQLTLALERMTVDERLSDTERTMAAKAICDLDSEDRGPLIRLLGTSVPQIYRMVAALLLPQLDEPSIREALQQSQPMIATDDPRSAERQVATRRLRRGLSALRARQGDFSAAYEILQLGAEPDEVTELALTYRDRRVPATTLFSLVEFADQQRLRDPPATDTRRRVERERAERTFLGLLLSLGEYSREELAADVVQWPRIRDRIARWYAEDRSSAVHGAAGWLLRHWGEWERARQVDETVVPYEAGREWFTREFRATRGRDEAERDSPSLPVRYMTFVVFPAGDYWIGSPETEAGRRDNEPRRQITIAHPFAIADREITWHQFIPWDPNHLDEVWHLKLTEEERQRFPLFGVNWQNALDYCQELNSQVQPMAAASQQPAWKMVFDVFSKGLFDSQDYAPEMVRLPTEFEWEVACRSGTTTAYSFGTDEKWLDKFGWSARMPESKSQPVGLLRPNPRGLFDMHGNMAEWCLDAYRHSEDGSVPAGDLTRGKQRVFRGGSFAHHPKEHHSARRESTDPRNVNFAWMGFRLCLTLPDVAPVASGNSSR
ncbi:MAG: SUMF1/EgtB/PvdO family nonheme iron enzyme [Pirellulales bacterium]